MSVSKVAAFAVFLPCAALAQSHASDHGTSSSPYAGEQAREIAALSEQDLAELRQGAGWGLARAAELNGVPGPTHLLELAEEIGLDSSQRAAIEAIRADMQANAILAGERFIAVERALNDAFDTAVPDEETLTRLVALAGTTRADLRLVHLKAHLLTVPLLTPEQIARYAVLRGYRDDPCAAIPEGHDAEMWRKHNGCD